MPCLTQTNLNPVVRAQRMDAIQRLRKMIETGAVRVVVSAGGAIAFKGWTIDDSKGVSDICAYRALTAQNAPELRKALMRAEALAGRKIDQRAIAAGVHSHDGGRTWGTH